jgi:putative transposase
MRNHYHLFAHTLEANLSDFIHQVQTAYASYYHYRYSHAGHLYQGRYKAEVVDRSAYGLAVSRYIHLNPVKVERWREEGLAKQRRYLRAYGWSSCPAYLGLARPHAVLVTRETLSQFGKGTEARKAYARYVEEGLLRDMENPFDNTVGQAVVGTDSFLEHIRRMVRERVGTDRDGERSRAKLLAPAPEEVLEAVADAYGVEVDKLQRRGVRSEARRAAIWLVSEMCGVAGHGRALSDLFGGVSRSALAKARARMAAEYKENKAVQRRIAAIKKSTFSA